MRWGRSLVSALLLLLGGLALAANSGRLDVRIYDEAGEPVEDVEVTVTESATNRTFEAKTNGKGKAMFLGVAGGEVIVRVESEEFQIVEKNAKVLVGQTAKVEATLVPLRRVLTEEEMTPEQLASKHAAEAYNAAVAQFQAGDYETARKGVAEALELEPDLSEAYLLNARLLSKTDDHSAAADSYIKALELNPEWSKYLPNLIGELQLSGRNDEAAIYTARLEGIPAETPEDRYDLALVKINAGDDKTGLELIEKILEQAPEHASAYYQRGLIRLRAGATVGTLEDMQRYLELAPEGPYADEARGFVAALSK